VAKAASELGAFVKREGCHTLVKDALLAAVQPFIAGLVVECPECAAAAEIVALALAELEASKLCG
jgi:hypothetical protein